MGGWICETLNKDLTSPITFMVKRKHEQHFESALTDLQHKAQVVEQAVADGDFSLERALRVYGITKEEYEANRNIQLEANPLISD